MSGPSGLKRKGGIPVQRRATTKLKKPITPTTPVEFHIESRSQLSVSATRQRMKNKTTDEVCPSDDNCSSGESDINSGEEADTENVAVGKKVINHS